MTDLMQAIGLLKANGYRVSKPKAKDAAPRLNALGLPMSPSFDPHYRLRHKVEPMSRLYAPQNFPWVQSQ